MAKTFSVSATCKIEWKVKHVFSLPKQESEEFKFQTSSWRLVLDKVAHEDTERIRITLEETKENGMFKDFTSRVFIADKNRMMQFLMKQVCTDPQKLYNECIWWMDVKDLRQREAILSTNGVVSFVCILTQEPTPKDDDEEYDALEISTNVKEGGSIQAHLLDFRRLLDDRALSDVTLKCGDRTIPAHRLILSARSEVFAAMLRNDMAESRSGVIEVSDMDPPVLDQLLQFIYSCKLPDMSMDTAVQLYVAADRYGVESLKKDCSAFMKENLTEENACSILLLADSHSDSDLKGGVMSFIVETKLFQMDEMWMKFCDDHPRLANEVLNRVCKTVSFIF